MLDARDTHVDHQHLQVPSLHLLLRQRIISIDGHPIPEHSLASQEAIQDQFSSTVPSSYYVGQKLITIVFVRAQNRVIG